MVFFSDGIGGATGTDRGAGQASSEPAAVVGLKDADAARPKLTKPVALRQDHILDGFDSGEDVMDEWLKKTAFAALANRTANTFVVCRGAEVVGYYALASASIAHSEVNAKLSRNAPDPIPAMLLARVAVATSERAQGLGRALVNDAMRRTLVASRHVAAKTLLVHALNANAVTFYKRLGFSELPKPAGLEVVSMHLPLDTIAAALTAASHLAR
jgi:predicted N-acetyltransferase YhbS